MPDPNDFEYGTGGFWPVEVTSGDPGAGATVDFVLGPGANRLVIYPDADIVGGAIQNAQVFASSGSFTGTFTLQFETGGAPDSIPVHVTALSLSMASFSFEGLPTGTNSIELAPDGPSATGLYYPSSATIQFDEPVHCLADNALQGGLDYYFRPILKQNQDAVIASGIQNPFEMLCTGRYVPQDAVPVRDRPWSTLKSTYR
jgi:hypothetical protein